MNTTWALIYIFSNIHHYFNLHYRHARRALDPGTIASGADHIKQRDYLVFRKQFKCIFYLFAEINIFYHVEAVEHENESRSSCLQLFIHCHLKIQNKIRPMAQKMNADSVGKRTVLLLP